MVSVYQPQTLSDAFNRIKEPWWWGPKVEQIIPPKEVTDLLDVPAAGAVKKWYRSIFIEAKVSWIAYHWLNPARIVKPSQFYRLVEKAGLTHLPFSELFALVESAAIELTQAHGELNRWRDIRMAALQTLRPWAVPKVTAEFIEVQSHLLRNRLLREVARACVVTPDAMDSAQRLVHDALSSAAVAAGGVLAEPDTEVHAYANLMVPVPSDCVEAVATALPNSVGTAVSSASSMWSNQHSDSRSPALLVVSETGRTPEHTGFWTPILEAVHESERYVLPGAPSAFSNHPNVPRAVLRHDPPPLRGFDERLEKRWRSYLSDHLVGSMWVSLPYRTQGSAGVATPAILNVHFDNERYRALDPVWQERARVAVAPFLEVAVYAVLLCFASSDGPALGLLDTGAPELDVLPGREYIALGGGVREHDSQDDEDDEDDEDGVDDEAGFG